MVEALAIKQGLQFTRDCGLYHVEVECNVAVVVGWSKDGSKGCSDMGLIIIDICALLPYLCCTTIEYVSRKANHLAKFAMY